MIFCVEFVVRGLFLNSGKIQHRFLRYPTETVVCVVVFYLAVSNLSDNFKHEATCMTRVEVATVLRFVRLVRFVPSVSILLEVISTSMAGFLTLFGYLVAVVIIYTVLAVNVLSVYGRRPNYTYPGEIQSSYTQFCNDNYHFAEFLNALITLLNMATGNGWTGIGFNLAVPSTIWDSHTVTIFRCPSFTYLYLHRNSDAVFCFMLPVFVGYITANIPGESIAIQFFAYFLFITFFIAFDTLRKTFMILILQNYEGRDKNCATVCEEPIDDFLTCWKRVAGGKGRINLFQLMELLGRLKRPLGLDLSTRSTPFLNLQRFAMKVLLSMPASGKKTMENDWGRTDQFQMPMDATPARNDPRVCLPEFLL